MRWVWLVLGSAGCGAKGPGEDGSDADTDSQADTDGDADTGSDATDSDADTDTDMDSESDGDTDTPITDDTVGETGTADSEADTDDTGTSSPDPNQLVWQLDGVQVAQSEGAESDSTYLFVPQWGRNLQLSWVAPPAAGTYGCADLPPAGIQMSLVTFDNGWAGLSGLDPDWQTLTIISCAVQPDGDQVDMSLTIDASGGRYVGSARIEIVGAGPRVGETLVVEATFDAPY